MQQLFLWRGSSAVDSLKEKGLCEGKGVQVCLCSVSLITSRKWWMGSREVSGEVFPVEGGHFSWVHLGWALIWNKWVFCNTQETAAQYVTDAEKSCSNDQRTEVARGVWDSCLGYVQKTSKMGNIIAAAMLLESWGALEHGWYQLGDR